MGTECERPRASVQSRAGAVGPLGFAGPRSGWRALNPRRQFVARMLLVVARTEPARYTYLTHVFGKEIVDVILDRRVEERQIGRASCRERGWVAGGGGAVEG